MLIIGFLFLLFQGILAPELSLTPTHNGNLIENATPSATIEPVDATLTAFFVTRQDSATQTAIYFEPTQTAIAIQIHASEMTATSHAIKTQVIERLATQETWTPTSTLSPEQLAMTPMLHNAAWTPYEKDFDGIPMVLVPAGCFMMGSTTNDDEQPVHEQCFDQAFWIDKYEVTNEQYSSLGCETYSSEPNQARNCVTWFDAKAFCESRSARLPTEKEWEYAARGPDNLMYSWGNEWDENKAVWRGNANNQTAPVGTYPAGKSWVGAMDMSGNLWEWVSALYQVYEYD